MKPRYYFNTALVAVALLGSLGSELLFSHSGSGSSSPDTPTSRYTTSPGFEYFPAQYENQATRIEDHVENF